MAENDFDIQHGTPNPLFDIQTFDDIDIYWESFPDTHRAVVASYHDGLRRTSGKFNNVFCGSIDECTIRYQTPAYYLENITGMKYTITHEPNRVVGPNRKRIDPRTEGWYSIDAPEDARRISPTNPYARLVAFSRQFLRITKKLRKEGLNDPEPQFKERLQEELKEFAAEMGLDVIA